MEDIRLYVLMRTDLPGGNCGKLIAQGTHAANQFVYEAEAAICNGLTDPRCIELERQLRVWQQMTPQGFGTCIVLGVTEDQLRVRVRMAKDSGHFAGITHDPTYPVMTPRQNSMSGFFMLAIFAIFALYTGHLWTALVVSFAPFLFLAFQLGDTRPAIPPVIAIDTCGFVFGLKDDVKDCLIGLDLMP